MGKPLTLAQTAEEVGLSASRFYRVWPEWVEQRGLPAPFSQPPGAQFKWDPEAVAEWKKTDRRLAPPPAPPPATPQPRRTRSDVVSPLDGQRNVLRSLAARRA